MSRKKKRSAPQSPKEAAPVAQPLPPSPPHRVARWNLDGALVVAMTIATFARGLVDRELLVSWDDGRFIRDFEPVHAVNVENLRAIWGEPHFQAFHPLHLMSYWLDVSWAGADAVLLGAVNLALWALALMLVLRVMRALGLGAMAAVIATLVYGLHPVQIEAVTWATGRKEILALSFASLAVLAHARSKSWRDRWAWTSMGLYLLAALSKTTTLPLPGVLFLIDVLLRGVSWRSALARQAPSVLLGLGLGAYVVQIWQAEEMVRPDAAGGEASGRVQLVFATLTHHVTTALFPARLSPVYPIERSADFGFWELVTGAAFVVSTLAIAWRLRLKWLAFAVLGFVVLLLPVLNLVPMYWLRADRYLSLPLLPLAFGVGALVEQAAKRWRWAPAIAAIAILILAARTVQHSYVYTSDARLWAHATSAYPESSFAWLRLGQVRRDAGDLNGAIRAYRRAVEAAPEMRLTNASLFYATVLRDEARDGFAPPAGWDLSFCGAAPVRWTDHVNEETREALEHQRAWEVMRCYHGALDDPERLRLLGGEMLRAGYRDSVLLVLGRLLDLSPVSDEQLEHAASVHLREHRRWLARFYVSRMGRAPTDPALQALIAR